MKNERKVNQQRGICLCGADRLVFLNNEIYRNQELSPTTVLHPTKYTTETTNSPECGLLYLRYILCRGQQTGRYEYH